MYMAFIWKSRMDGLKNSKADQGQDVLEKVLPSKVQKKVWEIAIGTNYNITGTTKEIFWFDEKIGGSVHMAVGQSYLQCGGKNQSGIHWDLIKNIYTRWLAK